MHRQIAAGTEKKQMMRIIANSLLLFCDDCSDCEEDELSVLQKVRELP
jgi:hypothetical protein